MGTSEKADRYTYRVKWSNEDQIFVADVVDWPLLMAHGVTPTEALSEITRVVAHAIELCIDDGNEEYPQPFVDNALTEAECSEIREHGERYGWGPYHPQLLNTIAVLRSELRHAEEVLRTSKFMGIDEDRLCVLRRRLRDFLEQGDG